jgi:short-chain fatty acids transporter
MSKWSENIVESFKQFLPNPFTIAIILTFLTFLMALGLTSSKSGDDTPYLIQLVQFWENGLWDKSSGGLYFAFQMMLMLVLGHCLALTKSVGRLITNLTQRCTNSANSSFLVAFSAIILGLFNWGLGLIFAALLAKSVGKKFAQNNQKLNYGLVGAAAYTCMMVWHGGLSGSAPTKVMEPGYLQELKASYFGDAKIELTSIPFESTIGSTLNIILIILLLIILPTSLYLIGKRGQNETIPKFEPDTTISGEFLSSKPQGAERLDRSRIFSLFLFAFLACVVFFQAWSYNGESTFGFIHPNFINLTLFALCLLFHENINSFLSAVQKAIGDTSGILIQFPLYFGILGVMKGSGLIELFSDALIHFANADTLPFFTFLSAGLVNFFVPSGGGQWAIQGPIIIKASMEVGADLPKTIMAMAYGDQLTNMLQPFWALPLLGITRLKAYQILPYTLILFMLGFLIFGIALLV